VSDAVTLGPFFWNCLARKCTVNLMRVNDGLLCRPTRYL